MNSEFTGDHVDMKFELITYKIMTSQICNLKKSKEAICKLNLHSINFIVALH